MVGVSYLLKWLRWVSDFREVALNDGKQTGHRLPPFTAATGVFIILRLAAIVIKFGPLSYTLKKQSAGLCYLSDMKYISLLIVSLFLASIPSLAQPTDRVPAQRVTPRYTGVYYRLTADVAALPQLTDSSAAVAGQLHKGQRLLVIGYPTRGWAQAFREGKSYYVRTTSLELAEKPAADAARVAEGANTRQYTPEMRPTGNSSQVIHTGPRGGSLLL